MITTKKKLTQEFNWEREGEGREGRERGEEGLPFVAFDKPNKQKGQHE